MSFEHRRKGLASSGCHKRLLCQSDLELWSQEEEEVVIRMLPQCKEGVGPVTSPHGPFLSPL